MQLAFGATQGEAPHAGPSSATSRRPTPPPHTHLVEFRDEAGELLVGDTVTVEAFADGDKVKVAGTSKGKGFQGTIKRHNFKQRPEVPRLAQRARPGLDRRVGLARARDEGHPRPGPDGQQARHPAGPRDRRSVDADQNLLLVRGAVPGARDGVVEVRTDG